MNRSSASTISRSASLLISRSRAAATMVSTLALKMLIDSRAASGEWAEAILSSSSALLTAAFFHGAAAIARFGIAIDQPHQTVKRITSGGDWACYCDAAGPGQHLSCRKVCY